MTSEPIGRVRIETDGIQAKVTGPDGKPMKGVRSFYLSMDSDGIPRLEIDLIMPDVNVTVPLGEITFTCECCGEFLTHKCVRKLDTPTYAEPV